MPESEIVGYIEQVVFILGSKNAFQSWSQVFQNVRKVSNRISPLIQS